MKNVSCKIDFSETKQDVHTFKKCIYLGSWTADWGHLACANPRLEFG